MSSVLELAGAPLRLARGPQTQLLAGTVWQDGPVLVLILRSCTDGAALACCERGGQCQAAPDRLLAPEWSQAFARRIWKLKSECRERGVEICCVISPGCPLQGFVPACWGGGDRCPAQHLLPHAFS